MWPLGTAHTKQTCCTQGCVTQAALGVHLHQPSLHGAVGVVGLDAALERHQLALHADHARDLGVRALEAQLVDGLEALFEVRLHASRVLGLGQDLR